MTARIGIIGAGVMGLDHARTIARSVAGAEVVAVSDADPARARIAADESGASHCLTDGMALIAHPEVDAVLVASPDSSHAAYTLACIKARKPVLCEKPLSPDTGECLRIIEAELNAGRTLVQVGFMRRFDPCYRELKAALAAPGAGPVQMVHAAHRNAAAPSFFTAGMSVSNSAVHEFDIMRWLLDDEIVSIAVHGPGHAAPGGVPDPLLLLLRMAGGALVDVEVFMNCGYGYDIRTEVVCQNASLDLARPAPVAVRMAGAQGLAFPPDWRGRFADAYRLQAQSWVDGIHAGRFEGSTAWDGYAATVIAQAGLQALATGETVPVDLRPRG